MSIDKPIPKAVPTFGELRQRVTPRRSTDDTIIFHPGYPGLAYGEDHVEVSRLLAAVDELQKKEIMIRAGIDELSPLEWLGARALVHNAQYGFSGSYKFTKKASSHRPRRKVKSPAGV